MSEGECKRWEAHWLLHRRLKAAIRMFFYDQARGWLDAKLGESVSL